MCAPTDMPLAHGIRQCCGPSDAFTRSSRSRIPRLWRSVQRSGRGARHCILSLRPHTQMGLRGTRRKRLILCLLLQSLVLRRRRLTRDQLLPEAHRPTMAALLPLRCLRSIVLLSVSASSGDFGLQARRARSPRHCVCPLCSLWLRLFWQCTATAMGGKLAQ